MLYIYFFPAKSCQHWAFTLHFPIKLNFSSYIFIFFKIHKLLFTICLSEAFHNLPVFFMPFPVCISREHLFMDAKQNKTKKSTKFLYKAGHLNGIINIFQRPSMFKLWLEHRGRLVYIDWLLISHQSLSGGCFS